MSRGETALAERPCSQTDCPILLHPRGGKGRKLASLKLCTTFPGKKFWCFTTLFQQQPTKILIFITPPRGSSSGVDTTCWFLDATEGLAQVTAGRCWETQGLAFGFNVVERGNGTVLRGHKNMQGPFGSNVEDTLAEGEYG